jgi:hypothetical protein
LPSSFISFSIDISLSIFAINSVSPSPAVALRLEEVENAAAYCVWAGFHAVCNKETGLDAGLLAAEVVSLEIARGAERAKHLIDSILKRLSVIFEDGLGEMQLLKA